MTPEIRHYYVVAPRSDDEGDAVYARLYADERDDGSLGMSYNHATREGAVARAREIAQRVVDDFPTWCTHPGRPQDPDGLAAWRQANHAYTFGTVYRPVNLRIVNIDDGVAVVWETEVRCTGVHTVKATVVVDGESYSRDVRETVESPWFLITQPVRSTWGHSREEEPVTRESEIGITLVKQKVWP